MTGGVGGVPGEMAKDKDVVNVGKAEIQVFKDIVHETLEGLGSVS